MATSPKTARPSYRCDAPGEANAEYERRRRGNEWRAWYGSQAWRRKSEAQRQAEPLCRMCKAQGVMTPATVADHVRPHRGDADLFWHGELQSLCTPHHSSAKQAEERAAR
ncbi:HNH endonuclease [Methylocystis parvus]|uniref:HNH endonuclease n=1 Tax=Methylocystis parvus TaxID=134 RepID=UPI003C7853D2